MSESASSDTHVPLEDSIPRASLESILCTEELHRRSRRAPDHEKENRALVALVSALADSPPTILQTLAETILDVTQCDSAGLSLLTRDGKTPDASGERFYWPAIAGIWNPYVGGGTPRNFSPCGDVLDQDGTLLFRHFERRYPYLLPVIPAAEECLLAPFHVQGRAVGTIWAITHSDRHKFDSEDERVMASLGKFASSAYQALVRIEDFEVQIAERKKVEAEMHELADSLEEQVRVRTTELQHSEERLRLAQEAARIGTFEWNIQTGVNTWTPELEAIYGLPPGGFGGTQSAWETLIYADDRAQVLQAVDKSLKTGQRMRAEWRVVWPDGSVHWITGRWKVFMDESGMPSRMIGANIEATERKVAEQALRESEQRFRLAAQAGKMYSFDWDMATDVVVRSPQRVEVPGAAEPLRFSYQQFVDSIHETDRPNFIARIAGLTVENPTAEVIYRARGSDGALVWLKSSGRAFFDSEGKRLRIIGMVVDITDLKRAEESLSEMSQKLIDAQEQERSRLARELHDDISQRLALLSAQLNGLKLEEARKQIEDIGNDIQALSHRLHSPRLDYLGLESAAAGFCRELSGQQGLKIDFRSQNVPKELPQEISLCLFRVLQEALQNAVKHSGSRQFNVFLRADANEIELIVQDSGIGFQPEQAFKGRGLGLTSMQERLRLIDGQLLIDSEPRHGTTIHARAPLALRMKSARATA